MTDGDRDDFKNQSADFLDGEGQPLRLNFVGYEILPFRFLSIDEFISLREFWRGIK